MARVSIDRSKCIRCGSCIATCPDVFVFDDEGHSAVSEEYRGSSPYAGDIPDILYECAKSAADHCSMYAIAVEK